MAKAIAHALKSKYGEWRRATCPDSLYCQDIDFVEYRVLNGEPRVVAILETTEYIFPGAAEAVKVAVLKRLDERMQSNVMQLVAAALGVPCYVVLYRSDMQRFHVYSYRAKVWRDGSQDDYRAWLEGLRAQ